MPEWSRVVVVVAVDAESPEDDPAEAELEETEKDAEAEPELEETEKEAEAEPEAEMERSESSWGSLTFASTLLDLLG